MSPRWAAFALLLVCYVQTGSAQDVNYKTASAPAAKEAFAEKAALKEQGFKEAYYNAKQQRLREHYLPVPIGPVPPGRAKEAAPLPPRQTREPQLKEVAGFGINLVQNRALARSEVNNATSTVCEPSVAARGQEILYTGNWFACFSTDGGQTFQYRNPDTLFPAIPSRPFCCDQVALYVPSHDLMIWFLQYVKNATGNTVRIAVAHGADIAAERWRYYDFTPQGVGNWANEWFDYPDLAASNGNLFLTLNSFNQSNQFQRSVAMRLPLDQLRTYAALNYQYFARADVGSLRLTHGGGSTMYIGTHANQAALRVFAWTDGNNNFQNKDFNVQQWVRGGAASPGPDGRDWLGFVDGRITAAWNSGTTQGFGWTSAQGGSFAKPNVRVAVINWAAGTVIAQPHIWNATVAFAYPAAAVNSNGRVGVSLCYNSSSLAPSHTVGVLNTDNSWALQATVNGSNGPVQNRWGDYLSIRPNGQDPRRFICTGFALEGGPNQSNIVPRVVQFDITGSASPPAGAGAERNPIRLPGGPAGVSAPVSSSVAASVAALIAKEPRGRFSKVSRQPVRLSHEFESSRALTISRPKALLTLGSGTALKDYTRLADLPPAYTFAYPRPESVCTPDDRIQVLTTEDEPWNGNCQLIITFADGSQAIGTGWLVGPRMVITAGHCVHEGEGGNYFKSVEVIPAMNGTVKPYGSLVSTKLRASEAWRNDGTQAADYGAILLPEEFKAVAGKKPAITPFLVASNSELASIQLTISGYPADKPFGTQWRDLGTVQSILPARLAYSIDTFGGHSGSAVTGLINGQRYAVGIHNYGGCPNRCTRITSSVKADLDQWLLESTGK